MRASRLMSVLFLLQQRRSSTASALAAELEVSVRTIYRDIAALQAAGVPVWSASGPGGGIRLVEGWRTRLDGLTGDEAAALFLAGAPSAVADLGLGAVLTAAETKVIATLPPELQGRASRLRERFHLDAPGWFGQEGTPAQLATVAEAVWSDRPVDVTYRRADRSVQRQLAPLGLVLKAGVWYLVAAHGDQVRTYRVVRFEQVEQRDGQVARPPDFDLATWWAASAAEFDRSLLRYRCRVRLSPRAFRVLRHHVSAASAQAAIESASEPNGEGWRELVLPTEAEEVAAEQLTAVAPGVEVLDPPSLRATLRRVGEALAARNTGQSMAV